MTQLLNDQFSSVVSAFSSACANGIVVNPIGAASPIPGWIEINKCPDGSNALMIQINPSDAFSYGATRSEISIPPEPNGERWYVWDMWMDSVPTEPLALMQIHDSPDNGESPIKHPNFGLHCIAGMMVCMVPANAPSELTSSGRALIGPAIPLVAGRWVQCALHAKWATDSSGFIEAFYDGKVLAREWNRACGYTDAVGPYWKLGLYDYAHVGITTPYRAWYRNACEYDGGNAMTLLDIYPKNVSQHILQNF